MLKRFLKDKSGATAVEYGLIIAVLSLAIVGGIASAGNSISNMFVNTSGKIDNSVN
jgi:pilus assembly protein Flp/PilA